MSTKRRKYGAGFKRKVVLEAFREDRTINEIASAYSLHPAQVSIWKRQAIEGLESVLTDKRGRDHRKEEETREARLMEKIGQLSVELDWLKKKTGMG